MQNAKATVIKINGIFSVEFYTPAAHAEKISAKTEAKAMQQFFKVYPTGDLACRPSTLLSMPSRDVARAHLKVYPKRKILDFGKHNQSNRWFVQKPSSVGGQKCVMQAETK